jgi:hypothetical protein
MYSGLLGSCSGSFMAQHAKRNQFPCCTATEVQVTMQFTKAKQTNLSKTASQDERPVLYLSAGWLFMLLPQNKVTPQWRYMDTGQTGSTHLPQSINN